MTHPSHVTRSSDSSLYDEICLNCGFTDNAGLPGAGSSLKDPCAKSVENGGKTKEEWEKEGVANIKANTNN